MPRLPGELRQELNLPAAGKRRSTAQRGRHGKPGAGKPKDIDLARKRFADRNTGQEKKRIKLYSTDALDADDGPKPRSKKSIEKRDVGTAPVDTYLEKDDAEIDYWEAKLGARDDVPYKHELDDDGLDDLLDGLDLPRGRSKLERLDGRQEDLSDGSEASFAGFDDNDDEDELEDAAESGEDELHAAPALKLKEAKPSPYVPPAQAEASAEPVAAGKYVPPALRRQSADAVLTKTVRGAFNKLSLANIGTIVQDLVSLFGTHARATTTDVISTVLLDIIAASRLTDQFIIVHAAVVAALYRQTTVDFAASIVQTTVEKLDYEQKTSVNLMALLCELYNLDVVASPLMMDLMRDLLAQLTEVRLEMLLVVVRHSGNGLRSDDPIAVKQLIADVKSAAAAAHGDAAGLTRTQFLIDQLLALKNNRLTEGSITSKEARTRMRKYIGNLSGKAEPLRVTLEDIRNVDKKGKWWLIGAAWRSRDATGQSHDAAASRGTASDVAAFDANALAARLHINNPVRKQLCAAFAAAGDWTECVSQIAAMRLSKQQRPEIARVTVLLVGAERLYNPFYLHVALGVVGQHGLRLSYQICLYDFLRDCGEDDSGQIGQVSEVGSSAGAPSSRKIVNIGKFYGGLLGHGALRIDVFKNLLFARLAGPTKLLLTIVLSEMFLTLRRRADSPGRGSAAAATKRPKAIFELDVDFGEDTTAPSVTNASMSADEAYDKLVLAAFGIPAESSLRRGLDHMLRKRVAKCEYVDAGAAAHVRRGIEMARVALSDR